VRMARFVRVAGLVRMVGLRGMVGVMGRVRGFRPSGRTVFAVAVRTRIPNLHRLRPMSILVTL